MATREYGFMGEKFPSKKFQQVVAKFLGHDKNTTETQTLLSYDELLQENKVLKNREQVIIGSIIECFGKRPVILDDVIHVPGETYNEMVRKINKVRITE
jgi:hypothetical protein